MYSSTAVTLGSHLGLCMVYLFLAHQYNHMVLMILIPCLRVWHLVENPGSNSLHYYCTYFNMHQCFLHSTTTVMFQMLWHLCILNWHYRLTLQILILTLTFWFLHLIWLSWLMVTVVVVHWLRVTVPYWRNIVVGLGGFGEPTLTWWYCSLQWQTAVVTGSALDLST